MSAACSQVPTQTLFATSLETVRQDDRTTLIPVEEGGATVTITSVVPGETSVQTNVSPTATLYSTRCPTTRTSRSTVSRMTFERSSTQPGGSVVLVTEIQTVSSQVVVVETQFPEPVNTPLDTNTSNESPKSHTGAIAGGIVGGVIALSLLAVGLWFFMKRRRNAQSTRNLDDFFSDPSSVGWDDKSGNGGSADGEAGAAFAAGTASKRTGTLRSFHRKSIPVLDLEKEKHSRSADDETHWAAMERVDSPINDDGDERHTNVRSQTRQSFNNLSRPVSFHSMTTGGMHTGFDGAQQQEGGENDVDAENAVLWRNDSDRSSKSAKSPYEEQLDARANSFDLLPAVPLSASPPLSPSSPPPFGSPYASPRLNEQILHEGVVMGSPPSFGPGHSYAAPSPATAQNGMPPLVRSSIHNNVGANAHAKVRTWSTGSFNAFANGDHPVERPKSAQGLNSVFAGPPSLRASQQYSPPMYGLRSRASLNGGTTHYAHAASAYHSGRGQQQRSPPSTPINGQYPPSQYAHLDVHKTEEERAEDHRRSYVPSSDALVDSTQVQRRHRSLSGDLLLRIANPEQQAYPSSASSSRMTPNSSGEDGSSKLSVRNADPAVAAASHSTE